MDNDAEMLAQALESLIAACTPADAEPNRRGEMRSVRTPDWTQVEAARTALLRARGDDR